jgi:hypothetical protein
LVARKPSFDLNDNFYLHYQELQSLTKDIDIPETFSLSSDERIDLVPIARGLKDLLSQAGITIEYLLNNDALKISEMLRIEESVVSLIQNETRKLIK